MPSRQWTICGAAMPRSEYQASAGQHIYVSIGRGYKAGGFNLGPDLPANQILFNPESDVNFETGYKADLFEHRVARRCGHVLYASYGAAAANRGAAGGG